MFIKDKLFYYLQQTASDVPRFDGQPKLHKLGVPICPILDILVPNFTILNKYSVTILKTIK